MSIYLSDLLLSSKSSFPKKTLPSKIFQPYDLIEWHYEPHANQKDLKLDTKLVIDGQRDDTS